MNDKLILKVIAKWLIPVILLFALYVQFHGDFGPGGGFQAGVIFSSAYLLYALVYGLDAVRKVLPVPALKWCAALGVILYTGTGVVSLFKGGGFLDYNLLAEDPVAGQHLGIILVELGVGLTVASVMLLIFISFSRRVVAR